MKRSRCVDCLFQLFTFVSICLFLVTGCNKNKGSERIIRNISELQNGIALEAPSYQEAALNLEYIEKFSVAKDFNEMTLLGAWTGKIGFLILESVKGSKVFSFCNEKPAKTNPIKSYLIGNWELLGNSLVLTIAVRAENLPLEIQQSIVKNQITFYVDVYKGMRLYRVYIRNDRIILEYTFI